MTLTIEGERTTLEVPTETWELYRRVRVRRLARQVVEPLERAGINELKFTGAREPLVVDEHDVPAYEVRPADEDTLLDDVRELHLEIASVAFVEGNKWRFSDGAATFWASMEDEAFIERINTGEESFRKGDVLRCRVRIVQSRGVDGLQPTTGS